MKRKITSIHDVTFDKCRFDPEYSTLMQAGTYTNCLFNFKRNARINPAPSDRIDYVFNQCEFKNLYTMRYTGNAKFAVVSFYGCKINITGNGLYGGFIFKKMDKCDVYFDITSTSGNMFRISEAGADISNNIFHYTYDSNGYPARIISDNAMSVVKFDGNIFDIKERSRRLFEFTNTNVIAFFINNILIGGEFNGEWFRTPGDGCKVFAGGNYYIGTNANPPTIAYDGEKIIRYGDAGGTGLDGMYIDDYGYVCQK